jgi:branched-chain amino acid transport system permease protein
LSATLPERAQALRPSMGAWSRDSLLPLAVAFAVTVVVHFAVGPYIGDYYAKVLLDIGINIILAVSLNLVNGFTGQFSIGHAGFMAVGGYTAGIVT